MATRRRVSVNPRLAIVAVLLGLAMLGLKARVPGRLPGQPAPLPPAGGSFPVAALLALAIPAIVLATIAALRLRRPPPDHDRPTRRRAHRWLGASILLALLAGTVAAAALAARLAGPTPDRPTAPTTTSTPTSSPDPRPGPAGDQVWLLFAAVVLLVLLVAAAFAHRQSQEAEPPSPTPALVRAVEQAIAAVGDPVRDPRTAIIQCYAAMEGALHTMPAAAPHAADSPSEVLDRAVTAGAIRSPGAWRLVELFDEARFSPHPMTEVDRVGAATALERILDELRGRR